MAYDFKKLGTLFGRPLLTTITDNDIMHVNQNGIDYGAKASNFKTTLKVDLTTTIPGSALDATQGTILKSNVDHTINNNLLFKYDELWTVTPDSTNLDIDIPSGYIVLPNKLSIGVNAISGTLIEGGAIQLTFNSFTNVFTYYFLTDPLIIVEGDDKNIFIIAKNIGGVLYTANASLLEFIKEIGAGTAIANEIHAADEKTIIVDADEFGIWDSVTGLLNKITWANLVSWIETNITKPLETLTIKSRQLSGFLNPRDVIINYNSTTRKVTLTGDVESFFLGIPMETLVPTFVSGWESPAHDVPVGQKTYFLSFDGADFIWAETPFFFGDLQIAWVFRDGVNVCLRECHGLMDRYSHEQMHFTIGTNLRSGGDIGGLTLSSTTAANRRPTLTAALLVDEDLPSDLDALPTGTYTWLNLSGANTASITVDQTEILSVTGNRPNFNIFTGGNWTQQVATNNNYGKVLIFAIPTSSSPECKKARFIFVQPQSESATLSTIQAIAPSSINFGTLTNVIPEIVCIGEIIVQYTASNWVITSFAKILGNRIGQSTMSGAFLSAVATDGTTITGNGTASSPLVATATGGHTIKNNAGTALATQPNMTFKTNGIGSEVCADNSGEDSTDIEFKVLSATDTNPTGIADGDLLKYDLATTKLIPQSTAPFVLLLNDSEANLSANGLMSFLPAGYKIDTIIIKNQTANSAGNISIGTSALGTQVVNAVTVGASAVIDCTLVEDFFSDVNDTDLYISSSAWGTGVVTVYLTIKKVI